MKHLIGNTANSVVELKGYDVHVWTGGHYHATVNLDNAKDAYDYFRHEIRYYARFAFEHKLTSLESAYRIEVL